MVPPFSLHSPWPWDTWLPGVCSSRWLPQVQSVSGGSPHPSAPPVPAWPKALLGDPESGHLGTESDPLGQSSAFILGTPPAGGLLASAHSLLRWPLRLLQASPPLTDDPESQACCLHPRQPLLSCALPCGGTSGSFSVGVLPPGALGSPRVPWIPRWSVGPHVPGVASPVGAVQMEVELGPPPGLPLGRLWETPANCGPSSPGLGMPVGLGSLCLT